MCKLHTDRSVLVLHNRMMDIGYIDGEWMVARLDALDKKDADVGVAISKDRSVVNKFRHGGRELRISEVQAIAAVLDVSILEVLYRVGLWDKTPFRIIAAPILNSVEAGSFADTVPDSLPSRSHSLAVEYPKETIFALRVDGDSMDRIAPEDSYVIVDYTLREVRNGELAVFRRNGEATFKRYRKDGTGAWLDPDSHNPRHTSIFPEEEETVEIIGRVIEVRPEYP